MLSESMLQKFTSKIQKLVNSNQTSQRLESTNKQITGSMEKFNSLKKIITDSKKKFKTDFNSNVIDIDQQSDSGLPQNIQLDAASDQNPNGHDSGDFGQNQLNQKINIKEKSKNQVATRLNTGSSTVKKIIQSASFQKQIPSTVQNLKNIVNPPTTKPTFLMPKVSIMNNLIKLSIKLNSNEILKQIKYQATLISLAPIRLLLYFCIEKMLYIMYETHGVDRMQQKSKDLAFLQKQIQFSLISLLKYLKISQRTMISRILRGVFNRLGIGANFTQKWLTDCLKTNKNAIEALNIDVDQIMKPPLLNNITSNIFIGITNPQKRSNLIDNYGHLELEDQNQNKQRIEDPQIWHNQQSLFFFKKCFSKFRQNKQKSNQNNKNGVKNEIKKDTNIEQTDNYELKSFRVQLRNIKLPENIKILTNPLNFDQFDIYKPINPQNNEVSDSEIVPRRRGRSQMNRNFVQQSKQMQRQPSETTPITKQQIIQIIQQYFNGNIEQIGNKIAKKWQIDPKQLKKLIKQTAFGKSMSSKIKSEPINVKLRPQTDNKSNVLQKAAVSHKQLVKQIFKLLQSKDLSHEKKQEIMDKWIALKKQKKMQRK